MSATKDGVTIFWENAPYEGKPLTRVYKDKDGVHYGGDTERNAGEEWFALESFGWDVTV
jgi:hypothetical protein